MEQQTLVKDETLSKDVAEPAPEVETNGAVDALPVKVPVSKVKEIKIEIDLDNLLIEDIEILDLAQENKLPTSELLTFLDRIVIGGVRERKLPMRYLSLIMDKLGEAVTESINPGN